MSTPAPIFSVHLKLFASFQEVIGTTDIDWQIYTDTTVGQLYDQLLAHYPTLEPWRSQTRFAVNLEFVSPDRLLHPEDEVVFIPPVSGG